MLWLYLLIAINYLSLMVSAIAALLVTISFTRTQRARYPVLKWLDGKQLWLAAIALSGLAVGYGAYTGKEVLMARLSLDVSIGPDGAPTEIASSIGLARELKHTAADLVASAKEDFREGERAFSDGRMADAEAAFTRSVASVPSMAALLNLALSQFRQLRLTEARSTLETGLALALKKSDPTFQSRFQRRLGDVSVLSGNYSNALTRYENALRIDIETDDVPAQAAATMGLGLVYSHQDRYAQALPYFKRALALYRKAGHSYDEPGVFVNMADTYLAAGDSENARQAYRSAITSAEALGNLRAASRAESGIAEIFERDGDLPRAKDSLQRAAKLYSQIGDVHGQQSNILGQAGVHYRLGEYREALQLLNALIETAERSGFRKMLTVALYWRAMSALELDDVKLAHQSYEQSLTLARELGSRVDEADALTGLGNVLLRNAAPHDALLRFDEALGISRASDYLWGEADALQGKADVAYQQRATSETITLLTEACPKYVQLDVVPEQAQCLAKLGQAYVASGNPHAALDTLRKADTLYRKSGVHDSQRPKVEVLLQTLRPDKTHVTPTSAHPIAK